MGSEGSGRVYEELGVKPVINAIGGNRTILGGSILSAKVNQAMQEANRYYADMEELLQKSGQIVADLVGVEAAYVTPGCCAALALGTAACMAGTDPAKVEQLPDVTGMRHQVIVQRVQRYKYDRCVTVPGAKLVEVGDEGGTSPDQIEAAIDEATVEILYRAPGSEPGVVPFEEVVRIAKRHGIPVIVDAAAQVYPPDQMNKYNALGADLVGFGAKYFGAPNSSGLLCGRKDLVEAASLHGFIGFEASPYRSFGRPLKLDRQEVIAVVVALRDWMTMDHQARFAGYERRAKRLQQELAGVPHIQVTPEGSPTTGVLVTLDEDALGKTAAEVVKALRGGSPSIWMRAQGNVLNVLVAAMMDGDEVVVADRLKQVLSGS